MIARLIRPDGTVKREWQTTRPDLALTADRNYPDGWRVARAQQARPRPPAETADVQRVCHCRGCSRRP